MLGTGTSTDPYQITTVAEFRSMTISTAYYKLMNNLDASTWNNGQWTLATLSFATLDGNGKTFSNIYNAASGIFKFSSGTCTVKNLTFANMIHNPNVSRGNAAFAKSSSDQGIFNNCVFNILVESGISNDSLIFNVSSLNYCTLNIKAKTASFYTYGGGVLYSHILSSAISYCAIFLDWTVLSSTNGVVCNGSTSHYTYVTMNNSYIRGKITNNGGTNSATVYPYITDNAISCYFALEFVGFNYLRSYNKCTGTCFYDNTLIQKNNTVTVINPTDSSGSGYTIPYALTTSQCKDKAYLKSIGFGVV